MAKRTGFNRGDSYAETGDPATGLVVVTPNDSTVFNPTLVGLRVVMASVPGTLRLIMADDSDVTLDMIAPLEHLDYEVKQVMDAGTTNVQQIVGSRL